MGLSDADIRRELKKNNIGGIKGVMRGKFEPFKVTNKNFQEMRRAGIYDQFPREEIQNIRRNMKDIPLAPDQGPPAPRRAPTPAPVLAPTTNPFMQGPAAPTTNPFLRRQGSLPQVLPTQARAPGPVNPALLGDNPIDAALNAQIANRQG
jgi:hypothetical protein